MDLPKAKFILTPAGYEKLRKELDDLESQRVQVSRNIKTAKGYGDLKENFEYHEAKREQGFVEGRIQELKIILPAAHVVQPDLRLRREPGTRRTERQEPVGCRRGRNHRRPILASSASCSQAQERQSATALAHLSPRAKR